MVFSTLMMIYHVVLSRAMCEIKLERQKRHNRYWSGLASCFTMLLSRLARLGSTSWGGSGGSRWCASSWWPAPEGGLPRGERGGPPSRGVSAYGSKPVPLFLLNGEKGTGSMNRFFEKVAKRPAAYMWRLHI